jgi:hypothetical protein
MCLRDQQLDMLGKLETRRLRRTGREDRRLNFYSLPGHPREARLRQVIERPSPIDHEKLVPSVEVSPQHRPNPRESPPRPTADRTRLQLELARLLKHESLRMATTCKDTTSSAVARSMASPRSRLLSRNDSRKLKWSSPRLMDTTFDLTATYDKERERYCSQVLELVAHGRNAGS